MSDHHETAKQALKGHSGSFRKKESYKVTHRLKDVNELVGLHYDLFILDRDCTLQEYHGKKRVPEFEETLKVIGSRAELVSNSSYKELLKIRDLYGDLMTISKLVKLKGDDNNYLLRFVNGELEIRGVYETTCSVQPIASGYREDNIEKIITYNFKKPNPKVINAVIEVNKYIGKIPHENPEVLMVGDRYLTDIVCGNLAGVDTARVKPYKPLSDKIDLIAMRFLDSIVGNIMSRRR